jgi:hypothetical protein
MQKALRSILVAGLLAAVVAIGAVILATSPVQAQAPGGANVTFNFSGDYAPVFHEDQPERLGGPDIGEYLGIPITDGARLAADTWTASKLTMPEHQCKPHPSDYSPRGPANLRIWEDIDTASQQLIAFHTHISWQAPERTIWMDGRPHPPAYAAHTWQGFSTGRFDGDNLVITTTHLKTGWIRRNGIPRSDLATVTEHWSRHDNMLDWMVFVDDPLYLSEPFVRTTDFVENKRQVIAPYPCYPVVEIDRPVGVVPSNLFEQNPSLEEFSTKFGIPFEATRGGARTMYPEFEDALKTMAPAKAKAAK